MVRVGPQRHKKKLVEDSPGMRNCIVEPITNFLGVSALFNLRKSRNVTELTHLLQIAIFLILTTKSYRSIQYRNADSFQAGFILAILKENCQIC